MASRQIGMATRRINQEFDNLTDYGNIKNINLVFDIKSVNVTVKQCFDDERYLAINKFHFTIKRKTNNKINQRILTILLPNEIANKINEYIGLIDVLIFEIDVEYNPFEYPFVQPNWNLLSISNTGFINETENAIRGLVERHNDVLSYDWSSAITLRIDLNYFLSKLMCFMTYI
jgi:hypothetical protein